MNAVLSMVNAWFTIWFNLPSPIRALVNVSIIAFFLVVLFQSINRIRS